MLESHKCDAIKSTLFLITSSQHYHMHVEEKKRMPTNQHLWFQMTLLSTVLILRCFYMERKQIEEKIYYLTHAPETF